MISWKMFLLQDPMSINSIHIDLVHNMIMMVMMTIITLTLYMMMNLIKNNLTDRYMTSNNTLEITWTIIPMIILMYMASPSLQLLYMMEETLAPELTIKSIGHQWYWEHEYPDFNQSFDSFMNNNSMNFRLMEVDMRMVVPFSTPMRIICTSQDVIHSWTIPSMGVKLDAIPGRMNQTLITPSSAGLFFGQCSEICGMNHSFMPLVMEVTSMDLFLSWINMMKS